MTQLEYETILGRVKKGERLIMEQGGFLEAPKQLTDLYQTLAEQCLEYEVEHDMIPELL